MVAGNPRCILSFKIWTVEFQISVFTLNYDDVVDNARSEWFDGFTKPSPTRRRGTFYTVHSFDPNAFRSWRDAVRSALGSPSRQRAVRLSAPLWTGEIQQGHRGGGVPRISLASDSYVSGQIVSATPIISGLSKVAKLSYNPEPFGYYYRAFIDSMLENDHLLVVGYGDRDEHFNTWIEQFAKIHGGNRKVGWVSLLPPKTLSSTIPISRLYSISQTANLSRRATTMRKSALKPFTLAVSSDLFLPASP